MNAAANFSMKDTGKTKPAGLLLGEDWVSPEAVADTALREGRGRRSFLALNRSPLARKIIIFNLMALVILVAGILFMNPFRDSLVIQREQGLVTEAQLIADLVGTVTAQSGQLPDNVDGLAIGPGVEVFLFNPAGDLVARGTGRAVDSTIAARSKRQTIITGFLNAVWESVSGLLVSRDARPATENAEAMARSLSPQALAGQTSVNSGRALQGGRAVFGGHAGPAGRQGCRRAGNDLG